MASSYTEREDSEESEADSEVEDGTHILSEPQKHDILKKEVEEEDKVSFCGITFFEDILYYVVEFHTYICFNLRHLI
jgi:hypothetical protein